MLALLALIAQLALSFGHVHSPHAAAAAPGIASAAAPDPAPADHEHDDEYCAICAMLALLTGAQCAVAPSLAQPTAAIIAVPMPEPAAARLIARLDSFRSRAPPVS
jgi:hypothetical protein